MKTRSLSKEELIESELQRLVPEQQLPYNRLFQAARYALFSGGKRLRPLLTLLTCELLGGDLAKALNAACAVECVHTYSLIHDDLPCMDDDDFRRGKPTLHKAFDEGLAVLTGDYLLTLAFDILAIAPNLSPEQKVAMTACLAKAAGGHGMIGGQVMDLAETEIENPTALQLIHRLKTGALITGAIECGAIAAEAGQNQIDKLKKFGQNMGLAFQIVDDLLDSDQGALGRAEARARAEDLLQASLSLLEDFEGDSSGLAHLATRMVHRTC